MVKQKAVQQALDKIVQEMRRGVIVLAVLSQLEDEQYGYSLVKLLADHGLEIDQGTLYPLLRRLEDQGLLESEWRVEGPRPRRYYQISLEGRAVLPTLIQEWNNMVQVLGQVLDR
jgi:DNA-binding PadR family transcriptional regulator